MMKMKMKKEKKRDNRRFLRLLSMNRSTVFHALSFFSLLMPLYSVPKGGGVYRSHKRVEEEGRRVLVILGWNVVLSPLHSSPLFQTPNSSKIVEESP